MHPMTAEDWTEIWKNRLVSLLELLLRPVIWRMYTRLLSKIDLTPASTVIELGSGTGKNSLLISKTYRNRITLVDNCRYILEQSKRYFKEHHIPAKFVCRDVLKLGTKQTYNLVFSEGLIEHFVGANREKLLRLHKRLTSNTGYLLIFVPFLSVPYKLLRGVLRKLRLWKWREVPFSKGELLHFCSKYNLRPIVLSTLFLGSWICLLAQPMK